jgi:branched-chain amino acid transport system substrate-binding protein
MKKLIVLITLLFSVLAAFAADKPVIKVGVVVPLSGNMAFLGENARSGMLLRKKEMSANTHFDYQLIFEDDEFVPAKTNMAVRKLKALDNIDVLVTLWANSYDVAMPLIKGSHIVHMSPECWANPTGYPYDFVLGGACDDYASMMANALNALHAKKIAVFSSQASYNTLFHKALSQKLEKMKITIADFHMTNSETRDFRTYALKLEEIKPDILVVTAGVPMAEIALRQMHQIGYHPLVAGGTADFLDINHEVTDGGFYVLTIPTTDAFEKKFQSAYKHSSVYPAANAYDTLSVLINACEQLPGKSKPSAEAISNQLRKTQEFSGAMGNTSFTAPNKLSCPLAYYLIQDGKSKVVTLDELVKFYNK